MDHAVARFELLYDKAGEKDKQRYKARLGGYIARGVDKTEAINRILQAMESQSCMSFDDIGERFGLSARQTERIYEIAIKKIQAFVFEKNLHLYDFLI